MQRKFKLLCTYCIIISHPSLWSILILFYLIKVGFPGTGGPISFHRMSLFYQSDWEAFCDLVFRFTFIPHNNATGLRHICHVTVCHEQPLCWQRRLLRFMRLTNELLLLPGKDSSVGLNLSSEQQVSCGSRPAHTQVSGTHLCVYLVLMQPDVCPGKPVSPVSWWHHLMADMKLVMAGKTVPQIIQLTTYCSFSH